MRKSHSGPPQAADAGGASSTSPRAQIRDRESKAGRGIEASQGSALHSTATTAHWRGEIGPFHLGLSRSTRLAGAREAFGSTLDRRRPVPYSQSVTNITTIPIACLVLAGCFLAGNATTTAADLAPQRLFDGRTFAGWEGETNRTWRITDGALVGGSLTARVPRNEFLCTTRSYTNFVLRLQFKLLGEGANAGVQVRSRRIPDHHEVRGYQADLGDPQWWGCLYDESRRNRVLAKSDMDQVNQILKRGDWNEYIIRCEGRRIRLWINGLPTVDYTEPDDQIELSGFIGVQIHGGPPSEAWYKDLTVEELP